MSSASPEVGEFLEEHVWPNLDAAEQGLLSELNPKRSSSSWTLNCPQCKKRRAYYYKAQSIRCNRIESCGYVSSVWTYLLEYKGLPKKDVFRTVCEAAGVTPPENSRPSGHISVEVKLRRILELALDQQLPAIKERWGYSDEELKLIKRYCGFYPNEAHLLSKLDETEARIAKKRGWIKKSLSGRMVGFWRQPSGRLGFWARHVSTDEQPKYLFQYNMVKSAPYLMEECSPGKPLVAVEGGRDVLALKMMGFKNCIGTGGSHLTLAQARVISEKHDKIIYIIDGDLAGLKGMIKTIANAAVFGITTEFVILPTNSNCDPDDYRRNGDLAGLKELWEKRVGAGTALALAYIELLNTNASNILTSEFLATRSGLNPAEKSSFNRTLQQFGIETNIEADAIRDFGNLLDHFGMEGANQIISRRYGIQIEILRSEPNAQ